MSNFVTLVVEDDALQREVVSELLRDNGLEVVECSTAEAAELVLASTGNELRALVTDINLAGEMSGVELAAYARRKFPCINIVVVSGKPASASAGRSLLPQALSSQGPACRRAQLTALKPLLWDADPRRIKGTNSVRKDFSSTKQLMEAAMGFGKGALLWLIGIPLPIILLLAIFMHH